MSSLNSVDVRGRRYSVLECIYVQPWPDRSSIWVARIEEILARIFDAYGRRADLARTQKAALATGLEKLARYEAALGDLMEQLALRPEKPRARLP